MNATLTDLWHELVTTGLLGTDRRDPPALPPGRLADTVADALPTHSAGSLARRRRHHRRRPALRRHAVASAAAADPARSRRPPAASGGGRRPLAASRHRVAGARGRVARRRRVERMASGAGRAGGPAAPAPSQPGARQRRARSGAVPAPLARRAGSRPASGRRAKLVSRRCRMCGRSRCRRRSNRCCTATPAPLLPLSPPGWPSGTYRWSHRAVLLNVVARIDRGGLARPRRRPCAPAAMRSTTRRTAAPLALWEALIELATVRAAMLAELQRPATAERRP